MKQIPGIKEPFSSQILNLFRGLPANVEVILFGSRAKGNFREGSDIDLALKGKGLTQAICTELHSHYENLYLPWKLDLVIYETLQEPALKEHIDRVGKRLDVLDYP